MPTLCTITDLRARPDFFPSLVQHVWQEWWQPRGVSRTVLEARAAEALTPISIPFALVAHDGDSFLGTVSVIVSDLDERPDLTPWLAALWVLPSARGQGIGTRLAAAAARWTFAQGIGALHLYAAPQLRPFYTARGWTMVESGVGPKAVDIYRRTPA